RAVARGEALGLPELGATGRDAFTLRALVYLGRAEEVLPQLIAGGALYTRTLVLAHAGRQAEVESLLQQLVVTRPGIGTVADEERVRDDGVLLEAAVLVGHREAARLLYDRLAGCPLVINGLSHPTLLARHLGAAALLLGDRAAALRHTAAAIKAGDGVPFRP